jgi:ABC-type phosphate transport system substrate-binding protein
MHNNIIIRGAALVMCLWAGAALAADFAIIVNKANANPIDRAQVTRMYIGELKAWPDGVPVALIDLPESDPLRAQFATEVAGKSLASLKALWAQHAFSGRALPPKVLDSDAKVKEFVAANKSAIGYVKASSVDETVKAVK